MEGGYECETGIKNWSARVPDSLCLAGKGLNLLKLHGSIDWGAQFDVRFEILSGIRLLEESEIIGTITTGGTVIFGGANKLTAEGPYLELLDAFRRELAKSERLIVVGYSFRDDHIKVAPQGTVDAGSDGKQGVCLPRDAHFARHPQRFSCRMMLNGHSQGSARMLTWLAERPQGDQDAHTLFPVALPRMLHCHHNVSEPGKRHLLPIWLTVRHCLVISLCKLAD